MDPVKAIYLSALCLIGLGAVLTWQTGETYSWLFIIPAVVAAGAYTLSPQLRWWHWKRNPPDLPVELAPIVERMPLYRRLNLEGKREFRRRAFLIREATDFQGMGIDPPPPDVRLMVAASAAVVTFHRENFLVDGFENVLFYPHLFPSPEHDRLHSSEMYAQDGVFIWTLNYLIRSVVEPDKYLQLGIYEYTRALLHNDPSLHPRIAAVKLSHGEVAAITGFTAEALREFVGLPELDQEAVTVVVFHTHAPAFAERYPDRFAELESIFAPYLYQSLSGHAPDGRRTTN